MTDINQVKCDKCGKIVDKIRNKYSYGLTSPTSPSNWRILGGKDFCPKCAKIIKLKFKEMLNEN